MNTTRAKRVIGSGLLSTSLVLALAGCGSAPTTNTTSAPTEATISDTAAATAAETDRTAGSETAASTVVSTANVSATGVLDATDFFSERDLTQVADTNGATSLALASGQDLSITSEGVYVISGEATDATIVVEAAETDKVQLVLDGASITNQDFPAIYVKSADKVFVTTTEGTTSTLQVTGSFVADGETNTDAVIFSRADLTLNGLGTLAISSTDNGISCKDDLKVCGGSYQIDVASDALEANDSIRISDGSLAITSAKDGLHAEDDDNDTTGFVYLCGGELSIQAADDAIHATTYLQVDGGTLTLNAGEALEATYIQVNGGSIDVAASEDAVNASYKSASIGTPTIEVTGGELIIAMGAGDTDALDSNGNLIVSGGSIDISGQFAFDFDGTASFTGGSITVNGEPVSEITNSMMMGGGMMGGPMGDGAMEGGPMGEMGGGWPGGGFNG